MPINHYRLDRDAENDLASRRAPRCYTRTATADAAPWRIKVKNVVVFFTLGALLCGAFLILSPGWSL
jgi:hypothetical protein